MDLDTAVDLVRNATYLALIAFTLIVTRLSGMVVIGPIFGHPQIPVQVRVFLVLAMSLVVTPALLGADQRKTFQLLDRNHDARLTVDEAPRSLELQIEQL